MQDEWFDEEEALVSASITDEQLAVLSGTTDLSTATFLQMTVDSAHVPLGTLGERMPKLQQLKLSGSALPSIRELGTSLRNLQVLWLCRCGLSELDGLAALPMLQELYLAFNHISQLSPLTTLEELQALDLEGNAIGEMESVEWLRMLPSLQELTLRGNPVCDAPGGLRTRVLRMLPNLTVLDDDEVEHGTLGRASGSSPEPSPRSADGPLDDVLEQQRREVRFVTEAIKQAEVPRVFDIAADGRATFGSAWGGRGGSRPTTAFAHSAPSTAFGSSSRPLSAAAWPGRRAAWSSLPSSALQPGSRGSPGISRPGSAFCLGPWVGNSPGRPGTATQDPPSETSSSDLTMGGDVICGVGALRRHRLQRSLRALDATPPSTTSSTDGASDGSEPSAPLGNLDDLDAVLLEELRALKVQQLLSGEDGGADVGEDEADGLPPADEPGRAGAATPQAERFRQAAAADDLRSSADVGRGFVPHLSSQEVTPTQTPAAPESECAGWATKQVEKQVESPASRRLDLRARKESHGQSSSRHVDILSLRD